MTGQQHPITPPSKLIIQWEDDILNERDNVDHVLDRAWRNGFQAGADAELDACCDVIARELICDGEHLTGDLRTVRRPKPPSLKKQALGALTTAHGDDPPHYATWIRPSEFAIIRRAIESLPD